MLNVLCKTAALAVAFAMLTMMSCGNKQAEQASQLSDEASHQIQEGNYEAAIIILDTLDAHYANQVDIRRSAMKYRAMAIEGLTLRRITAVDDTLALLQANLEQLKSQFEYVANPGKNLGGNYVEKSLVKKTPTLLPRVNDDDYFTLSVRVPGKAIGFSYITFKQGGETISTNPISNAPVMVEGHELTVIQQEDVDAAMRWLQSRNGAMEFTLNGSKSTSSGKLTAEQVEAMKLTWQYAMTKQAYRLSLIEREKLERKLSLTRDQLANLIDK